MADIPLTSFAGRLGTGLGNVLGGLAQGYAEHKLGQLEQKQQNDLLNQRAEDLKQFMPGASDQQLRALARLGEDIQKGALQGGFGAQPQQVEQPQFQQPGTPQMPQMLLSQPQQQQQFEPLRALQQLTPQAQQQIQMLPPYFQQEVLRRMGEEEKEKKKAQRGMIPEMAPQMAQQQGQPQQVPQQPGHAPVTLGQALGAVKAKPFEAEKFQLSQEKHQLAKEIEARQQNKSYTEPLENRGTVARNIVHKAGQMKELLDIPVDNDESVASGWSGWFWHPRMLGSTSEIFNTLAQDVAAEMTGLQSGVQTISKIKFNESRKPNLGMNRETQIRRTQDLLDDASRIILENNVRDYITEKNNGIEPKHIRAQVQKIYSKLENNIPSVPKEAQEGEAMIDPKTNAIWVRRGHIMEFQGFAGE